MSEPRNPVWTSSAQEQYLYLVATFGDPGNWTVEAQRVAQSRDGANAEDVDLRLADGSLVAVQFRAIGDDDSFAGPVEDDQTGFLDQVMEAASTFAINNPPQHPGTLARFPVPSVAYAGALSVPMAVQASGSEGRGLFAPPRVVVIGFDDLNPIGVGEFPGFDPESWPPPLVGMWPPSTMTGVSAEQTQAMIGRFSACWHRILVAWFDRESIPTASLFSDIDSALGLRGKLDLPGMSAYYERLNPVFAKWLKSARKQG